MTKMMSSTDRRNFAPRRPSQVEHPHYLPRPMPTHSTLPRRYEPYRRSSSSPSSASIPRRIARPSSIHIPPVPPAPHSTPSPLDIRIGPKNYDPLRPEGLYQASKGARRDIKWMQKHSVASPPRPPPQAGAPLPPSRHRTSLAEQRILPPPPRLSRGSLGPGPLERYCENLKSVPLTFPKRPSLGSGLRPDDIKEQQDVIAAARAQYIREKQDQKKVDSDRKVKRIQMQVFVHARPTPCPWGSCPALLNSWALLEKHLHHAHLHPNSKDMPLPGQPVTCRFKTCDQVFGTGGECYQHCLSAHMGTYGARCPFNCAFQGPSFDELMAHIGRRHHKATPDDFVPGLIHHLPPNLPPRSALPELPVSTEESSPRIHVLGASPTTPQDDGQVQPYNQDPSPKVISLVRRKCFSHKKPLPDNYAKIKGSLAAIDAILENIQRERLLVRAIPTSNLRRSLPNDEDAKIFSGPIRGSAAHGLYHSPPEPGKSLLDLIDIDAERRRAEREARKEIKRLTASGLMLSDRTRFRRFWTRSHSGESDSSLHTESSRMGERTDEWYQKKHRQRLMASVTRTMLELSDDSDSNADGGSDSASVSSDYIPRHPEVTGSILPIRRTTRMAR